MKTKKQIHQLVKQNKQQLQAKSTYQRVLSPKRSRQELTESEKLVKPGLNAASSSGEPAFTGDTAALSSDDNIDLLGQRHGVNYKTSEKLNMAKKINIRTPIHPPTKYFPYLDTSQLQL